MRLATLKLCMLLLLFPLVTFSIEPALSDRIVITVGDQVVMRSEFEQEKAFFIVANQVRFANAMQEKQFERDFAKMIAETELQLLVGKQFQIGLESDDISVIKGEMQARHGARDETEFREALTQKGIDYDMFMKQAERQFLLKKIHGYILGQRVRMTDKDIEKAYQEKMADQYELYVEDIFYSTEKVSKDKYGLVQKKSQYIADVWSKGTFTASTVPKRGKMLSFKWQKLDQFPAQFREVVANMKVGDVSQPVQTDNGFHVLKLIKKKLPKGSSVDRNQLKQELYVSKMTSELPKWLDDLREQTYVNIQLD